ncbi:TonB-dependent receptor [Caballeronia udeis]|uniref:TonB-dependent receptor n=1 Tax=Caballeronia udeis TaxID=1232866 RepID=A0A158IEB7_9BURK|nr:TonB-dependent receptor [Caballeronia udeis]SAL54471.1 TonB-dependent receptor [Caballeronia udeis]
MGANNNRNRPRRGRHHNGDDIVRPVGGRYASLIVGPAIGLTVLCAHAQTAPSNTAPDAAPVAASAPGAAEPDKPKTARKSKVASDTTTLNTVEITANRRREPAREVPMQVNALSAQELQRKGDQSVRDYLKEQPGVSLVSGGNGAGNNISMRGVTTGSDIGPTVGVYVDEVPFGSSTNYGGGASHALDMALLDLNHVELLRGPQGTLYGAGAMGGLLKYVTNEPDTEGGLSGRAGVMFSGTEHGGFNHTEDAVVNVPIKQDVAAFRVSAFNQQDAGYVNRIGSDPEKGVDGTTTRGGRASLTVTPTRDLTIRLTATTQQIKSDGSSLVDYNFTTRQPIFGDLTQSRQANEPYSQLIELYSANIEYDFGWARLNSISAYQTVRNSNLSDGTSTFVPLANSVVGAPMFTSGIEQFALSTDKFTQELRLTSPANRKLEWIAGLFFTDERSTNDQILNVTGPEAFLNLVSAQLPSTYREYAGYGDLTYHFTSRLSATAGLRIAHNDQTFTENVSGPFSGGATSKSAQSADTSKTYLFTLDYLLTQNSSVYGRVASGYRPGGPQPSVLDVTTGKMSSATFQPDTLTSYELGYKADFLEKRASISLSAFDIEWKDIQLFNVVDGLNLITNGAKARSKGLEFFGSLVPTPQWHLGMGLAYTDARLTQDVTGIGARSGDRLPNTPALSVAANLDYLFNVGSYRAYLGATESYVGRRTSGFPNSQSTPNFELPAYVATDLRAGIDLRKANVSLFVHNLFNRRGMQSASNSFVQLGGPSQILFIQPLTIGMQVDVPF